MAIRFVDKEPEGAGEAAKPPAGTRRATAAPHAPAAMPDEPSEEGASEETVAALPHAKPEPKAKGRKAPMSAAGQAKAETAAPKPEDPPAEALFPGLQVHAKPTPKPRGRKKAFG